MLSVGEPYAAIAMKTRFSPDTIRNVSMEIEVLRLVEIARRQFVQETTSNLCRGANEAIHRLRAIMVDPDASHKDSITAAAKLLEQFVKVQGYIVTAAAIEHSPEKREVVMADGRVIDTAALSRDEVKSLWKEVNQS